MKKKSGLFVKINYKNCENNCKNNTADIRRNSKIEESPFKKYLLCGGVLNKEGGTMIFQASNMEEAEAIAANNPFTGSKVYRYEILNGDVISLSA